MGQERRRIHRLVKCRERLRRTGPSGSKRPASQTVVARAGDGALESWRVDHIPGANRLHRDWRDTTSAPCSPRHIDNLGSGYGNA